MPASLTGPAIAGARGTMGSYLAHPSDRPADAGVVLLHEIFGVNHAMTGTADRLAHAGYAVLVPDLFHEIEPGIALSYAPKDRPRALELWAALDVDAAVTDTLHARDRLREHLGVQAVAVLGFCLGGKVALLAGAQSSAVDTVVAFYPVQTRDYRDALRSLRVPVQVHLGDRDAHVPPEAVAALREDLAGHPDAEVVVHPGAEHAFFNAYRPEGFHQAAAAAAESQMLAFLNRTLLGAVPG